MITKLSKSDKELLFRVLEIANGSFQFFLSIRENERLREIRPVLRKILKKYHSNIKQIRKNKVRNSNAQTSKFI